MLAISTHNPPAAAPSIDLKHLRALCLPAKSKGAEGPSAIPTALPPIDATLPGGGLACGAIHELLGLAMSDATPRNGWLPPLTLLIHLARCVLKGAHLPRRLVWIGSAVFPFPPALGADALAASLFVRARTPPERLWAADLALRSGAVGGVILDASDFPMFATRRLQLAAESSRSLCLLAKPPWQEHVLTAAHTRWRVSPAPSQTLDRNFTLELIRCKGLRTAAQDGSRSWILEVNHATRTLGVAADLRDRSGNTPPVGARAAGDAPADRAAHQARCLA